MNALSARIQGIGVLGPGLGNWAGALKVLSGVESYRSSSTLLPTAAALPAAERRRAGRVIRLALAVGAEAVAHADCDAGGLPSVFTSSGGDGDNCHAICATLAGSDRMISPTRFHNSVHNAAAGYWSIAYACTEPSVSLCAHDASFGAGLLEALTQVALEGRPVLLLAYDADYPPPLREGCRIPDAFGTALVLAPLDSPPALATIRVALCNDSATILEDKELEALRVSNPAARALPLLQRIALSNSANATVVLDYLDSARLRIEIGS
jgi:hypothetical protein